MNHQTSNESAFVMGTNGLLTSGKFVSQIKTRETHGELVLENERPVGL